MNGDTNPFYQKIRYKQAGSRCFSAAGTAFKCLLLWIICLTAAALAGRLALAGKTNDIVLLVCSGLCMLCPALIYFKPEWAGWAAIIYAGSQGVLLQTVCRYYTGSYAIYIWLAVGITALAFVSLLVLYLLKLIRVGQNMGNALKAGCMVIVAGGLIVFVSQYFSDTLYDWLSANPWLTVIVSAVSLTVAVLRLVYEFGSIEKLVIRQADAKYEWTAAYGLFMAVIIIFFRLLRLLAWRKKSRRF